MNFFKPRMCTSPHDVLFTLFRLKLETFEADVSDLETQIDKVQILLLLLLVLLQLLILLLALLCTAVLFVLPPCG